MVHRADRGLSGAYAELHCHTNFSFLEGASHPEDLVVRAVELGLPAVAVTDHGGLYGQPRFAKAASEAGLAAIVGHVFPVWIGFRGGKGVATACGVFAVLAPAATAAASLLFLGTLWWTRYVSVGSLVASAALGPVAYLTSAPFPTVISAVLAAALIAGRHRGNLARLQSGTERRLGSRSL